MERNTHQKRAVMDALAQLAGRHPKADAIYETVKTKIPEISKATVYRILNQSVEQGDIRRIRIPSTADRYDSRLEPHYHFRCQRCGKVVDVDINMPSLEDLKLPLSEEYVLTGYDMILSGFCTGCNAE